VLSVEKGENIVVDRLVDLNKQLTVARAQRIEAESLHRTVENRNHHDLADIMKQGLVQQLKSSIANLEAEKARLGTVFKPEHPRIQELNQQIANARQAFNREINSVVGGIKSSYAAALAKERALQAEAEKQQQDALRLKELGVDYTVLQEDVNSNRLLYESVVKRLNETSVSKDLAVSNMQIAERAAKPLEASAPNVMLYVLASIFSGLLLGVGTALLQEFFDSTVATPDEVWRSVGLGTLGVVPHLKPLNGGNGKTRQIERKIRGREQPFSSSHNREPAKELIISHGPLSIVSESYRTIRASLLLSQAEKPPQVILLTSPSPGEGKTVTSANLAIALAHDGHSVLLVDGDMRRGTCHTRLGLRNGRGLSNVLAGGVALEESIQSTAVSGLSLLPRGVTPPNPSELLGSRKMREILDELRQKFEFIVIDSPPVIALSDAAVLSVVSDGVLLVFDGQRTSTAYAQKAVERLETVRARLLGVILNGVNLDDPHYSYYQAYYSYYQMPNGEDPITPAGNETVDWLNGKNKIARNGKAPTNVAENAQSIKAGKRQWEYPLDTSVEHLETPGSVDALRYSTQANSRKSQPASNDFTVVSQEFMNRLLKALLDAVGPVAPLILRDHIALLGESQDAFPKSRVDELVKLIAPEILHAELRSRFQKDISEEMRNMERG
jgi:capsular exopolysaccharide synthesis family protein